MVQINSSTTEAAPRDGRLTSSDYWDGAYGDQSNLVPLDIAGFRNRPARLVVELIESVGLPGKDVIEVGAGNSSLLCYLARRYSNAASFCGLDYSDRGCTLLRTRARAEGVSIEIIQDDLFAPPANLKGRFDVVYSMGVVEHFSELAGALAAKKWLMSDDGTMVTVIPNMAGLIGRLTQRYAPSVYRKHVPHDLESFRRGHIDAGLSLVSSGYLCSTNFGVLSSCFPHPATKGWYTFLWLSRLSKALWLLEGNGRDLFHSGYLSPFLFAVARNC